MVIFLKFNRRRYIPFKITKLMSISGITENSRKLKICWQSFVYNFLKFDIAMVFDACLMSPLPDTPCIYVIFVLVKVKNGGGRSQKSKDLTNIWRSPKMPIKFHWKLSEIWHLVWKMISNICLNTFLLKYNYTDDFNILKATIIQFVGLNFFFYGQLYHFRLWRKFSMQWIPIP